MLRTNPAFLFYIDELLGQREIKSERYEKGKKLFVQNEVADRVFVVREGIAKCYFTEEDKHVNILEFLGKGEIVGEIEFLRKIDCLCTVEAMTELEVYSLPYTLFTELLDSDFKLNIVLLEIFAERMLNAASRSSHQQLYTVEDSLEKLLEFQNKQDITISKKEMATYLGVTAQNLNKAFKHIKED